MKTRTFGRQNFVNLILAAFALSWVTLSSAQAQSTASVARARDARAVALAPVGAAASQAKVQPEEESPSKGLNTGIKVHGHWVIEVKNPDGKVVSHTEFENALQPFGQLALVQLFQRFPLGEWGILLGGSSSPCVLQIAGPFGSTSMASNDVITLSPPYCIITESGPMITAPNCGTAQPTDCSQNLKVGASASPVAFTLTGSVVASGAGTVSTVDSIVAECGSSSISPATCAAETAPDSTNGDSITTLTEAILPAQNSGQCGAAKQPPCAVPVAAGQTVHAQVTISFQ